MLAAPPVLVCNSTDSAHVVYLPDTEGTMADGTAILALAPGDCFQSNGGDRVRVAAFYDFKTSQGDSRFPSSNPVKKKSHAPGIYTLPVSAEQTIIVRVY